MKALLVVVWLLASQVGAVTLGEMTRQSPNDFNGLQSGCPARYNAQSSLWGCATRAQLQGTRIVVTLSPGTRTTVSNSAVMATSTVRCGCDNPGGSGAAESCSRGGMLLAWVRVVSTTTGSFVLHHAHALGDEQIACVIEG